MIFLQDSTHSINFGNILLTQLWHWKLWDLSVQLLYLVDLGTIINNEQVNVSFDVSRLIKHIFLSGNLIFRHQFLVIFFDFNLSIFLAWFASFKNPKILFILHYYPSERALLQYKQNDNQFVQIVWIKMTSNKFIFHSIDQLTSL